MEEANRFNIFNPHQLNYLLIFFLCITNFYPFIICVYYLAG